MRIRVSPNGRHLTLGERPFFYLADTAWELLHRLNRAECDLYLRDRAAKGFNVIHTSVVPSARGLREVNAYGYLPMRDSDPAHLVEAYFDHVDWTLHRAEQLGLILAVMPLPAELLADPPTPVPDGARPAAFNADQLFAFGEKLGRRYRDDHVIWIVPAVTAGAAPAKSPASALARGLRRGGGRAHLTCAMPAPNASSSAAFHASAWLDFNFVHASTPRDSSGAESLVAADYLRRPAKPVLLGRPCFEDEHRESGGRLPWTSDADVRRAAYATVFNGACGAVYGCGPVWQFHDVGRSPQGPVRRRWQEAMHLAGATQFQHLRALMESRPPSSRRPAPGLIVESDGAAWALAGARPRYVLVYAETGAPFTLSTSRFSAGDLVARWFDPRTGVWTSDQAVRPRAATTFTPPATGVDWVLLLEQQGSRGAARPRSARRSS